MKVNNSDLTQKPLSSINGGGIYQLTSRDSNFELLRIIAMFMIVGSHYCSHGIRHALIPDMATLWHSGLELHRRLTSFLLPGGGIGNGIFFMLTGFFMFGKTYKADRLIKLLSQVFTYALFVLIAWIALRASRLYSFPELSTISQMMFFIHAVIPITSGAWWFIQTYVVLFLFIPVINGFLDKLSVKKHFSLLVFAYIFWFLPTIFSFGYSQLQQAVFYYILGAFLRRSDFRLNKWVSLAAFAAVWIALSLIDMQNAMIVKSDNVKEMLFKVIYSGIATVIRPFAVLFIFEFCKGLKIGNNAFINTVASTTFGIYLIHDSGAGRQFIWNKVLHVLDFQYESAYFPLLALASIFAVFVTCSLLEYLRQISIAKPIEKFFYRIV